MTKHEILASKPIPIGINFDGRRLSRRNMPITTSPTPGKRSLWRPRSSSEAPASMSRSPITKAFDFLPWARSKKTASDKSGISTTTTTTAAAAASETVITITSSPPSANTDYTTNTATASTIAYKNNNDLTYHRNITRKDGGILAREILGDKLHQERQTITGTSTLPNPRKKCNQNQPKQMDELDKKSLDMNGLIECVENEMAVKAEQMSGPKRFLDDTFVEKIISAHDDYRNRKRLPKSEKDCMYSNYLYRAENGYDRYDCEEDYENIYDNSMEKYVSAKSKVNTTSSATSTNNSPNSPSTKHILFNDENKVYLIKNELPVKREVSKSKAILDFHSNPKTTKVTTSKEKDSSSLSVLKARLKLKKLLQNESETCHKNKLVLMNNQKNDTHENGNKPTQINSHHDSDIVDADLKAKRSGKRFLLQRQNTTPAAPPSHRSSIANTPMNATNNEYQEAEEPAAGLQRRRSLTDTGNTLLFGVENSSSGSTCSAMAAGNGSKSLSGCIISDRPKTDKPRKKLSFREPVVSDKLRSRRLSTPLNQVHTNNSAMDDHRSHDSSLRSSIHKECNSPSKLQEDHHYHHQHHHRNSNHSNKFRTEQENSLRDRKNVDQESQAMRIVRTVGQAFEVCHKFNLHKNSLDNNDERSDISSDLLDVENISEPQLSEDDIAKKDQITIPSDLNQAQRPNHLELKSQPDLNIRKSPSILSDGEKSPTTANAPLSPTREIHKLKDQLEQQTLQTRQALAQLMLVREQLISETNARMEAQARTQQLLQQNRELLEHLASLGAYTEQQTPGLTTANIAMAPQSHLQMLLQATGNSNNLATINQQINSLGSINQQLTSLSHQLSGLNQQSQNLQNLQNIAANFQQQQQQSQQQHPNQQPYHLQQQQQQQPNQHTLSPPTPTSSMHQPQLHLNVSAANNIGNGTGSSLSSSPFASMNQLQSINSQLQNLSMQQSSQQQQQLLQQQQQQQQCPDSLSKDLFQVNQELLNRLQALNLGSNHSAANTTAITLNGSPLPTTHHTPSPNSSSFFFINPMSCSPSNNNNSASNFNFLASPSRLGSGNLTPSPIGTLNRSSYSHSPINDEFGIGVCGLSIDRNLNSLHDQTPQKSSEQLNVIASNSNSGGGATRSSLPDSRDNSRSSSTLESPTTPNSRRGSNSNSKSNSNGNGVGSESPSMLRFNTVMLKVTDEAGNVTNQKKLSATPSFITRSTSEKVPNRSQMMSQVQRTAWARHTTK